MNCGSVSELGYQRKELRHDCRVQRFTYNSLIFCAFNYANDSTATEQPANDSACPWEDTTLQNTKF